MSFLIPTVISRSNNSERAYDIYSYLLKNRIIFLNGPINDEVSSNICAQLIFLDSESSDDISLYINSPGGSVYSTIAIYDTMNFIKCDVKTFGFGLAASCGSWLLCAGAKGKRFALPNLRYMLHEPSGGFKGRSLHFEDHAKEIMFIRNLLINIYKDSSKASEKQITKWLDRETFLSAKEALEYGFVDEIVLKKDIA